MFKFILQQKFLFLSVLLALVLFNCYTILADDEPENYVTLTRVNLRKEPSTDSEIILTVNTGSNVVVEYLEDGWYKVVYNTINGFMKSEYVGKAEKLEQSRARNVELTPWSEAKSIFTVGVPAEIYDVRTGKIYYVKSFSNGNHADVEPITKEDTAIMFSTYNGKWSWNTRPILVTINGHSMAASINGMPHGGGVNNSNNMNGQICIHFKGSTTHNGNKSHERDHQNSVTEAYNKFN